jgi:hypothetical protein
MKNKILFFFLSLFAFSCSKNDSLTFEEKILGKWEISSFVINSCPSEDDNVPLTTSNGDGCIEIQGGRTCMSITFLADKKAMISNQEFSDTPEVETVDYQINETNNTVSLCQEGEDCIIFTLEADNLSFDMDESGCICVFGFEKS